MTWEDALAWWEALLGLFTARLFSIGETPISLSSLLQVLLFLFAAFWVSKILRMALRRLQSQGGVLNPASVYTLDRIVHYVILVVGLLMGLSAVGIDFTTFAVMAGAVGIGVGLGLQTLVANFFAGLVLLLDRSLKVGDFVELESGLTGQVRQVNIRSTVINSNDNVDVIVPNSEFINGRVINWTHNEDDCRVHIGFGVAYGSDKEVVRQAVLEAAAHADLQHWFIKGREPQVWFVEFGDSSLNFELLVWLNGDGVRSPGAVRAAILWEIHSALERHDLEVPFPQRDLHVRSLFGLKDEMALAVWERGAAASRDADGSAS